MEGESLETISREGQIDLYNKTRLEYNQLNKTKKDLFYDFCKRVVKEQYTRDKFIQESEKYLLEDNVKWYIFGFVSAEIILSPGQLITDFFEYFFRQYSYTHGHLFYCEILHEKLQDKESLNIYERKIKDVAEYANKTSLDYVRESAKEKFRHFLVKEQENKDILKVLDNIDNAFWVNCNYAPNPFLHFALAPLLDISTNLVVEILSEIDCIFLVKDFLLTAIRNHIDLICRILSHIPKITNKEGEWDNKKILLPLLIWTFSVKCNLMQDKAIGEEKQEKILRENIEKFVCALKKRPDCYFITRKWLLYLVSNLDKGLEVSQKITKIQIETIAACIVDKDFREKFFNDEKGCDRKKELLLALIYTTNAKSFPREYLEFFEKYILDLNNKIFIGSNKLLNEHDLLSRLFVKIDKPDKKWADLWRKLYVERQDALYSGYTGYKGETHSQYLILVGMSAIEYFISDEQSDLAINLLNKIWVALMELYLTIQYFIFKSEEFLNTMITRHVLRKNLIGADYKLELNMLENNPELISYIIINLKRNNADLKFLSKEKNILRSVNAHMLRIQKGSDYDELKGIYKKYSNS
ncbi:MAG: hypothetical protein J6P19_02210 [Acetobacter sp.]|nr:hypothetical protein [Acetobacter sp.]